MEVKDEKAHAKQQQTHTTGEHRKQQKALDEREFLHWYYFLDGSVPGAPPQCGLSLKIDNYRLRTSSLSASQQSLA